MTQRILLSPNRVSISRPGYDVVSPPAFTTDYLAIDSGFPQATRLYQSGVLYNLSIQAFSTTFVSFGKTFASYPFVTITPFIPGSPASSINLLYMKFDPGSPDLYHTPYNIQVFKDRFRLGPTTSDTSYAAVLRNWIYFVFAP
jgi:hypothetical protein